MHIKQIPYIIKIISVDPERVKCIINDIYKIHYGQVVSYDKYIGSEFFVEKIIKDIVILKLIYINRNSEGTNEGTNVLKVGTFLYRKQSHRDEC